MIKTVGDLRRAIKDVPDELEVLVRAFEERDDGDVDICVPIWLAEVEPDHCDDGPDFFVIDAREEDVPALQVIRGGKR